MNLEGSGWLVRSGRGQSTLFQCNGLEWPAGRIEYFVVEVGYDSSSYPAARPSSSRIPLHFWFQTYPPSSPQFSCFPAFLSSPGHIEHLPTFIDSFATLTLRLVFWSLIPV